MECTLAPLKDLVFERDFLPLVRHRWIECHFLVFEIVHVLVQGAYWLGLLRDRGSLVVLHELAVLRDEVLSLAF